jgi:hypothetical protein
VDRGELVGPLVSSSVVAVVRAGVCCTSRGHAGEMRSLLPLSLLLSLMCRWLPWLLLVIALSPLVHARDGKGTNLYYSYDLKNILLEILITVMNQVTIIFITMQRKKDDKP